MSAIIYDYVLLSAFVGPIKADGEAGPSAPAPAPGDSRTPGPSHSAQCQALQMEVAHSGPQPKHPAAPPNTGGIQRKWPPRPSSIFPPFWTSAFLHGQVLVRGNGSGVGVGQAAACRKEGWGVLRKQVTGLFGHTT